MLWSSIEWTYIVCTYNADMHITNIEANQSNLRSGPKVANHWMGKYVRCPASSAHRSLIALPPQIGYHNILFLCLLLSLCFCFSSRSLLVSFLFPWLLSVEYIWIYIYWKCTQPGVQRRSISATQQKQSYINCSWNWMSWNYRGFLFHVKVINETKAKRNKN